MHIINRLPTEKQEDGSFLSRKNVLEGTTVQCKMEDFRTLGCLVLAYIPTVRRKGGKAVDRMVCRELCLILAT